MNDRVSFFLFEFGFTKLGQKKICITQSFFLRLDENFTYANNKLAL